MANSIAVATIAASHGAPSAPAGGRAAAAERHAARMRGAVADHGDDLRLVERMLAGDASAFEAFGERYFRALYRFALSRLNGDGELARELTQTTLAKALARIDSYRGEAALLTWLCACCRNEILMYFRSRRAAPEEIELEEERLDAVAVPGSPPPPSPEAVLLDREEASRIHAALEALPDHYAQALEWKYLERLAVREIAGRMEISAKAAESLLTRARQAFRETYTQILAAARPVATHLPSEEPDHE